MENKPYHVGLVKQGNTLVIQYAESIDQLSCELWKYAGERMTSGERLKANGRKFLAQMNRDFGTSFTRVKIERIGRNDFTAGHVSTLPQELAEANAAR
jgi:hypothetical protein